MRPFVRPTIPEIYTVQQIVNESGRRTVAEAMALENSFEFGPSTEYLLFGNNWARNCKLYNLWSISILRQIWANSQRFYVWVTNNHVPCSRSCTPPAEMVECPAWPMWRIRYSFENQLNTYTPNRRATCTERTKRLKTAINAVKKGWNTFFCVISAIAAEWNSISRTIRYVYTWNFGFTQSHEQSLQTKTMSKTNTMYGRPVRWMQCKKLTQTQHPIACLAIRHKCTEKLKRFGQLRRIDDWFCNGRM